MTDSAAPGIDGEHVALPDGTQLWTSTHGHGIPVVLNHGGPGGYDHLEPLAELIDDIALVHRYDQRGCGRSSAQRPVTLEQLVSDLDHLRRHWNHKRWVVAGHSWGAHLALFYALNHPAHTAGLISISGPPLTWGWGQARRATRLQRLTVDEQAELPDLERHQLTDDRARRRLRELWWLADFADRETALRSAPLTAFPRDDRLIQELERDWQHQLSPTLRDHVRRLTTPALVLHGEADPLPARGAHELANLLPNALWTSLPAVGHTSRGSNAPLNSSTRSAPSCGTRRLKGRFGRTRLWRPAADASRKRRRHVNDTNPQELRAKRSLPQLSRAYV